MTIVYLIVALVIALLAVAFALQNTMPIAISFLAWTAKGSLSLVVLITLVIGIVIGLLVLTPSAIKNSFAVSHHLKRIGTLEKELDEHKAKIAELQKSESAAPTSEASDLQQQ